MEPRVSCHRLDRLSLDRLAYLTRLPVSGHFMTSPLRRGRLPRLVCYIWTVFILTWAVAN